MKLIIVYTLFAIASMTADAQVFVNLTAVGNNDGTSWSNAFTNLQDAIDAAAPGSQLWIAAGTYVPEGPTPDSSHFITLKSLEFYGGFSGKENSLSERNWQAHLTILSGDINGDDTPGDFLNQRSDNAHHILIVNAPVGETIIDGLLFQGGMTRIDAFAPDATDVPYHRWRGGGLYIYKSRNIIRNCIFRDNYGTQGSGLFAAGDTTPTLSLAMENTLFESNAGVTSGACWISGWRDANIWECKFQQNYAGAYSAALSLGNGHSVVEDCVFEQNDALSQGGACLIFNNSLSLISHPIFLFSRCEFKDNTAATGGAIRFNNFSSSFSLTFDSCAFTQNIATNSFGSGGALYVVDSEDSNTNEKTSVVRFDRTTFTSNTATYGGAVEIDSGDDSLHLEVSRSGFFNNTGNDSGGGLYAWMLETSNTHTEIEHTIFEGNTARVGGGLVLDSYLNIEPMTYLIDSCTFSNNTAELYGGGIGQFLTEGPGLIGSIRHSQFLNNQAKQAGALISRQETLEVENCHFKGNYAQGFAPDPIGGGGILFVGPAEIDLRTSIFEENSSDVEGSALINTEGVNAKLENVLFQGNHGLSTFLNAGDVQLVNVTMSNNQNGLLLEDGSVSVIQNSIFNNSNENLRTEGVPEVISNGSNISSDGTMVTKLTGSGNYDDLHKTDPLLGPDFVPVSGSPCIDAGNPQGIKFPFDLAGNPRQHGGAIDIGSYESFLVATQDALWNVPAFHVYPNPVKDVLHFDLEMDWIGEINLTVYNYAGQPVHRDRIVKSNNKQSFSENLGQLVPGEYVLLIRMGENTYAVNIIVQ